MPETAPPQRPHLTDVLIGLGLVTLTLAAYWHAGDCAFNNWDDEIYVTKCPPVLAGITGRGLIWACCTFESGNWHPLTWLSLQLDAALFGISPRAFHRTNVVLHTANVVLLFLLLRSLTGARWPSAVVAGLFAVHPLHVESVAWVAERKDVLSTFFGLLALLAYAWYARRPGWHRYLVVCLAYTASLLAKPMLVTLPILLLLVDFWPLQRFGGARGPAIAGSASAWYRGWTSRFQVLLAEKLPLFALALVSGIVTLYAQMAVGALKSPTQLPLGQRVGNALWSVAAYLGQTIWPTNLAIFYPQRPLRWDEVLIAGALLAALSVAVSLSRRPVLLVGWLWFLIALLPVSGLVQVGSQARADRYTYVPHIGLFIAGVWMSAEVLARFRVTRVAQGVLIGFMVLALTRATALQLRYWENSMTLWSHALIATEPVANSPALINLSRVLVDQANSSKTVNQRDRCLQDAQGYLTRAVEHAPDACSYMNLGLVLQARGKVDEARQNLLAAIRLDADYPSPYVALGKLAAGQGQLKEAETSFRHALRLRPDRAEVRQLLGDVLVQQGQPEQAIEQFTCILQESPHDLRATVGMGKARMRQYRLDEAAAYLSEAVRGRPNATEPYFQLGLMELLRDRPAEAVPYLQKAASLAPRAVGPQALLAYALGEARQGQEGKQFYGKLAQEAPHWQDRFATEAWELATHSDPQHRDGRRSLLLARVLCGASEKPLPRHLDILAAALAEVGRYEEAVVTLRQGLIGAGSVPPPELQSRLKLYEMRQAYHQSPGRGIAP